MEQRGRWPRPACTTNVLLDSEERHERTLLPTLNSWWVWLRAPEVSKWQERHRVGWDATGRNGEAPFGKRCSRWRGTVYRASEMDQGATTLVLEPCQSPSCVDVGDARQFLPGTWYLVCDHFEHQRRVQFEWCVAEPRQTITAIFPCVEEELTALSQCASRCPERSDEGVSAYEDEGLRGRYHSFHEGRHTNCSSGTFQDQVF